MVGLVASTWRQEAACAGTDPAVFYPEKRDDEYLLDVAAFVAKGITVVEPYTDDTRAKAVCRRCPVTQPCTHASVVHGEHHGIWGVGDQVRRHLRREWLKAEADPNLLPAYLDSLDRAVRSLKGEIVAPWTERRGCTRCANMGIMGGYIAAGRHPEDQNGPDARCGFPVTYARGCRCWHCKYARTQRPYRARLARIQSNNQATMEDPTWARNKAMATA